MTFTLPQLMNPYPVFLEVAPAISHFKDRVVRQRPTVDSTKVAAHSQWLWGIDTKI
jgi:hypothetical protein